MKNKFYYEDYRGKHTITLNRACPEYINADCPEIYLEDGSLIYKLTIAGTYDLPLFAIEDGTGKKLISFLKKSDIAFRKKYQNLSTVNTPFEATMLGESVRELEKMIERGY